ncbi:MAG: hypothetical protein AB8G05_00990 [Oligoflexales bacterium]
MGIQTNNHGFITSYYAEDLIEYLDVGHKQFRIICTPSNRNWIEEETLKRNYKKKEIRQEDDSLEVYQVVFEKDA